MNGNRILPGIFLAVILAVIILTWGSIGSAVCVYGLIMLAASLIYQRFLTNREDDFKDE